MTPFLPRFGLVFVACPLALSDGQRHVLVRAAGRAWFEEQPEVHFDGEGCRGTLWASSDATTLGTFTGQRFTAEVHLVDANGRVEFLVAERLLQSSWSSAAEA